MIAAKAEAVQDEIPADAIVELFLKLRNELYSRGCPASRLAVSEKQEAASGGWLILALLSCATRPTY